MMEAERRKEAGLAAFGEEDVGARAARQRLRMDNPFASLFDLLSYRTGIARIK